MDPHSPYLKDFDQRDFSELSQLYRDGKIGDEFLLAEKLQKLASRSPQIRFHLDPLLKEATAKWRGELQAFRCASLAYPKVITHARWASMTNPEKYRILKLAHQPFLKSQGLTKALVREGSAFMVYKIDKTENSSKFYEGLIVEENGGFRLLRRWGRLTDSGASGRIDGANADNHPKFWFQTLTEAQAALQETYRTRLAHGYVDTFGPKHRTPDGHALPMGQYPIGLGGAGFGWGGQSVTNCIPALKQLEEALTQARFEIQQTGRSDAVRSQLEGAQKLITEVAREDSTMAQTLLASLKKALHRVMGSPRHLPDPEGKLLLKELFTINTYVRKQMSLCS
jgi:predicted DNA-binding WGR domain protein